MTPRARKILLAAALLCSCAASAAYYYTRRPLEGTGSRYELRADGRVWRIGPGSASPVENAVVRSVAPAPPYCAAWTAVSPSPRETEGVVLFRSDGQPAAFLPCENAPRVTAVSASPGGRVLAVIKEPRGEIDFYAMPERAFRGTILAFGPVLWRDETSGAAFARDGAKVQFSLSPGP